MFNFSYSNSTVIHFGEDMIKSINNEIPQDSKVLFLYGGGSIKKNGVYDKVIKALVNYKYGEFSGIEPNPQYDTLMKAVKLIKEESYDYLLAVGGGSVVDGTKFIAAAVNYQGNDPWEILAQGKEVKSALPLGCVLTLPATGSESNTGSVVSRGKDKLAFRSIHVLPKFAILDPTTTYSLSAKQTSNGIVDAFVHTIEQYLTYPVDAKIQDRFAEGILLTLIEDGVKVLKEPKNLAVRSNIMWAATQALNGLIGVGVPHDWVTHVLGHGVTAYYGVDHARTLSIILPAVMKKFRKNKQEKIIQYAERVWQITKGSSEEIVEQAIEATVNFFHSVNAPTSFSEEGITPNIDELINSLEKNGTLKFVGEHGAISLEEAKEIYTLAL